MATYAFANVSATLQGPGASISLGYGAGVAKEGLTSEMLEDKDLLTIGADGSAMHSLRSSNAARLLVRLLKTSPVNSLLSFAYNFQRASASNWGQNYLVVSDIARGDNCAGRQVAFARQPVVTWAEDANFNEWQFLAGHWIELLGAGVPDINTATLPI
jgi:hypothetical protein